ncbi:hypothetical protein CRE_08210 [Caenorhabditis remanei]|uniref:F-box associated domain-containing protein n=1 Tax=Caenorhabditis remanei TaxID=31234 RepID=E3M326_CAERE|nr:hypothetical protein CRE_08210 [Caenorhabditis remanei]
MNNLIVSVEKARFNKIKYILYKLTNFVSIEAVNYDDTSEIILRLQPINSKVTYSEKLSISGTSIEFDRSAQLPYEDLTLRFRWYSTTSKENVFVNQILESIQRHNDGLIGDTKECRLYFLTYGREFMLPKLRNVSGSYIFLLPSIDGKTLDEYCSASPNQDFLQVRPEITSRLKEDSAFFGMKCIDFGDPNSLVVPELLRKFTGRQAFTWTSNIESSDVIRFLKKWKSNESFENLETLHVTLSYKSKRFNPAEIKNSIDIKIMDGSVVYSCKRRIDVYPENSENVSFDSINYIVREHDQRVASIVIEEEKFVIGVWNLTEGEFLKKFSRNIYVVTLFI